MSSLLIIPLCLGGGWVLRRMGVPLNVARRLSQLVIYGALPALVLEKIPVLEFQPAYLMPMLMPWVIFILAIALFSTLAKVYGWDKATLGALILTAGLGNTSFVGIPVMQALWGEAGVAVALLADQPGSFACLSTLGIVVASSCSGESLNLLQIARRVLRFPPFLAFLLAIVLNGLNWLPSGLLLSVLAFGGSLVVPLALVAVGLQLSLAAFRQLPLPLWIGLGYKLLLAPTLIFILYLLLLGERSLMAQGSVMEAAMGPMVTAALVAEAHNLRPRLVHQILSVGIGLSFISLPLWWLALRLLT